MRLWKEWYVVVEVVIIECGVEVVLGHTLNFDGVIRRSRVDSEGVY